MRVGNHDGFCGINMAVQLNAFYLLWSRKFLVTKQYFTQFKPAQQTSQQAQSSKSSTCCIE